MKQSAPDINFPVAEFLVWSHRESTPCRPSLVLSSSIAVLRQTVHAPAQEPQAAKELTIEDDLQGGGILGRGPEAMKWSPDGTKVSFVQRDDSGEHGALYFVDANTGRRAVLVAARSWPRWLRLPAPSRTSARRKRRSAIPSPPTTGRPTPRSCCSIPRASFGCTALDSGTAVQITSSSEATRRSQVLARRQPHRVRPQAQPVCAGTERRKRTSAHQRRRRQSAERRSRLGLRGGAVHAQQLLLVARRQADRLSPDEREGRAHLSHHRLDADRTPPWTSRNIPSPAIRIPTCAWAWWTPTAARSSGSAAGGGNRRRCRWATIPMFWFRASDGCAMACSGRWR